MCFAMFRPMIAHTWITVLVSAESAAMWNEPERRGMSPESLRAAIETASGRRQLTTNSSHSAAGA